MGRDARKDKDLMARAAANSAAQHLRDRYGRPIVEGGNYEFHPPLAQLYTVHTIAPVMHPGAPPGLFRLTMISQVTFDIPAGPNIDQLTLVSLPMPAGQSVAPPQDPPDNTTGTDADSRIAGDDHGTAASAAPAPAGDRPADQPAAESGSGIVLTDAG